MIKILFICHGNICKSPMAEFIMKDLVNNNSNYIIDSKATTFEEIDSLLSELLELVSDDEYNAFIEKNSYMKKYDSVSYLEDNKYGVLSDEMPKKSLIMSKKN